MTSTIAERRSVALVVASKHHGNTLKIAEAMAEELDAVILPIEIARREPLETYDLVGFGSGIYYARHDPELLKLAEELSGVPKRAFLFSTAGNTLLFRFYHSALRKRLGLQDCEIVGEFNCPGWDTFGPFAWMGGLHKHRPNPKDIEAARNFARGLRKFIAGRSRPVTA